MHLINVEKKSSLMLKHFGHFGKILMFGNFLAFGEFLFYLIMSKHLINVEIKFNAQGFWAV
jgi:hypothetical protein